MLIPRALLCCLLVLENREGDLGERNEYRLEGSNASFASMEGSS